MKRSWYCDWMQKRALKGDDPSARAHVAGCPVCREAMADLTAADERLRLHPGLIPAAAPPSDLWDRVSAGIEARRPSRFPARPVWVGVGVATASLALGFLVARPQPESHDRVASAPSASESALPSGNTFPATPAPRPLPFPTKHKEIGSPVPAPPGASTSLPPLAVDTSKTAIPMVPPVHPALPPLTPGPAAQRRGMSPGFSRGAVLSAKAMPPQSRSGGRNDLDAAKDGPHTFPLGLRQPQVNTAPSPRPRPEDLNKNRLASVDTGSSFAYNSPQSPSVVAMSPPAPAPGAAPSPPAFGSTYGEKETSAAARNGSPAVSGIGARTEPVGREKLKETSSPSVSKSNALASGKATRPVPPQREMRNATSPLGAAPGGGGFGGGAFGNMSDRDTEAASPFGSPRRAYGKETGSAASDSLSPGVRGPAVRAATQPYGRKDEIKQQAKKPSASTLQAETGVESRENLAARLQNRTSPVRSEGPSGERTDPERAGMAALKAGRWRDAVAAFGRVKNPSSGILYCTGQAYLKLGRREAAIQAFRQALVRDPNYAPARRALDTLLDNE